MLGDIELIFGKRLLLITGDLALTWWLLMIAPGLIGAILGFTFTGNARVWCPWAASDDHPFDFWRIGACATALQ
jgi:hypothetical protein